MTALGVVAHLDNGQGTRNECGVLTDDVRAIDWGRRRDFGSAQRSGAVVLGYQREGEGGVTPLLDLQRLDCDLYGGDRGVRWSASGWNAATRCKVLTDGSTSKKPMTPRRVRSTTQAGRRHELGGISMAALGDADEVARRWLGGMVTLTCARRTDGEAVSYDGGWCGGERWRLPWRRGGGVGPTRSGRLRL
jgi:hypothetical protein